MCYSFTRQTYLSKVEPEPVHQTVSSCCPKSLQHSFSHEGEKDSQESSVGFESP